MAQNNENKSAGGPSLSDSRLENVTIRRRGGSSKEKIAELAADSNKENVMPMLTPQKASDRNSNIENVMPTLTPRKKTDVGLQSVAGFSQKSVAKIQYLRKADELQDLVDLLELERERKSFDLKKKRFSFTKVEAKLNAENPDDGEEKQLKDEHQKLKDDLEYATEEFGLYDFETNLKIQKLNRAMEIEHAAYEGNVTAMEENDDLDEFENNFGLEEDNNRVADYVDNLESAYSEGRGEQSCVQESPLMVAAIDKIGDILKAITTNTAQPNSSEKLATRQTLGRDLPIFNGQPESWPSFYAAFENTTKACGFTEEENIERVRKCLKGDAFQTVKGLFGSTSSLNSIMSLLQRKYGQPKLIIQALIDSVKKCGLVKDGHPDTLIKFGEAVGNAVATMRNMRETTYLQTPVLVNDFVEKLSNSMLRHHWHRSLVEGSRDGNLEEFSAWIELETRAAYLECPPKIEVESKKGSNGNKKSHSEEMKDKMKGTPTAAALLGGQEKKPFCIFCDSDVHYSSVCEAALSMTKEERSKLLAAKKFCFRCYRPGHMASKCKTKIECQKCKKRHLYFNCPERPENSKELKTELVASKDKSEETEKANTSFYSLSCRDDIKMMTVIVCVQGSTGVKRVRVLFDNGCQASQGVEDVIKKVGGQFTEESVQNYIQLTGPVDNRRQKHYEVTLSSLDGKFRKKVILGARKEVCPAHIPCVRKGPWIQELNKRGIVLTDFHTNCVERNEPEIEIIIGSDYYAEFMERDVIPLECGLYAVNTKLGWTLSGKEKKATSLAGFSLSLFSLSGCEKDLWDLETIGVMDPIERQTKEESEQAVMKYFQNTVAQDENGRYEVRLPWKMGKEYLTNNFAVAEARLKSTTAKLVKAGKFWEYDKVFKDWEQEKFIEEVLRDDSPSHYLPHRGVFKPESLTTPVRPVYDASCKSAGKLSLNDCLEKGPNLLRLIPAILLRFREKKIGVTADIRKAFQMISIHPEDRDYVRFLWWVDGEQNSLKVFRHSRVVFGINCSPFLLVAVIKMHLEKVTVNREVSQKLEKCLYVDNCVTSVDSQSEYQHFKTTATKILKEAAMDLRQWESNIDSQFENAVASVLGLKWDKPEDCLYCAIPKFEVPVKITKREVLSLVQRVFDPLGFLSPALLIPKLLLQKTWQLKVGWDTEIPQDLMDEFAVWWEQMDSLAEVKVPRKLSESKATEFQIHTFCDASAKAYSAVVFLRSSGEEKVTISLLQAKTRVAPLKSNTIPRLELLGCLIASRLTAQVIQDLEYSNVAVKFWTDSTTALAWIQREGPWGTFVDNRIAEIRSLTNPEQWFHIPGIENPADLPSRGCLPKQLARSRWWEGPSWLKLEENEWPASTEKPDEEDVQHERKKGATRSAVMFLPSASGKIWYNFKFASYQKCLRVLAWILRLFNGRINSKPKLELTQDEIGDAEKKLFRLIQAENFDRSQKRIGGIRVLVHEDLLCVQTKLLYREDSVEFRLPVLLPAKNPIVEKLILEMHVANCHAGTQILMSLLREKVWILQGRREIRRVINSCSSCKRFRSKPLEVEPSPLPLNRIKEAAVFEVTGIDLAGPLYLKDGSKSWFVIYTCAVYRCIHLELVDSMSTEMFILALIRFVKRRGRPSIVYTDNGSNFIGAVNLFSKIRWEEVQRNSDFNKIKWIFNPPSAPWWGGFWERLIQNIKDLLKRMLGNKKLSYVQLETMLCEVEAAVNSRPLTVVTEDAEDLIPLTPSMFLHEIKSSELPEANIEATPKKLFMKYNQLVTLRGELRQRFRKEYLSLLVHRGKTRNVQNIAVGDVVLVELENQKRQLWPIGRVLEVYPGKDTNVRVARVKTTLGERIRPLQKLYPMEMGSCSEGNKVLPIPGNLVDVPTDKYGQIADSQAPEKSILRQKNNVCGAKPRRVKCADESFAVKSKNETLKKGVIVGDSDADERKTRRGRLIKRPPHLKDFIS